MLSPGSGGVAAIASASAEAAETAIDGARNDPTIGHAFWLLTQLPLAAGGDAFADRLAELGLEVRTGSPGLFEIGSAMALALETAAWTDKSRTDLGAMARQAAVESLLSLVGEGIPRLFEPTGDQVQGALAEFARSDRFSVLARDFFSRLCRRSLEYFLSRELPNHVGPGRRFASIADHSEFAAALDLHCRQASRIIDDFAGDWFGKRLRDQESISQLDAAVFARIAFRKIRAELKLRRENDA
jgi:hypothetical protein